MYLARILDDFSSGSSGETREKFKPKQNEENQQEFLENKLIEEKSKRENEYWH